MLQMQSDPEGRAGLDRGDQGDEFNLERVFSCATAEIANCKIQNTKTEGAHDRWP